MAMGGRNGRERKINAATIKQIKLKLISLGEYKK
jgi:hypothetical protein